MQKKEAKKNDYNWFKVDNAGKLYANTNKPFCETVYRISVNLKEDIKPVFLDRAVNDLKSRFPTFFINCKAGFFWAFFETNPKHFPIQEETPFVDQYLNPRKTNNYLFAVYYYRNRISLECLHALSDGYGALEFLKAITFRYLELCGYKVESEGLIFTKDQEVKPEELEDSYNKYYTTQKFKREKLEKGYYPLGKPLDKRKGFGIIYGKMDASELVKLAKSYNSSINQFITALYVYSVYKTHKELNKKQLPIQPCVPVNLRSIFPSRTLRNFSLVFYLQYSPKEIWTLKSIIEKTKEFFAIGVQKDKLQNFLNANVNIEKNIGIRILPYFIKRFALGIAKVMADGHVTRSISNLGIVKLPESVQQHVINFECAQPDGVSIMTSNNIASIAFVRTIADTNIEQYFFNQLAQMGIQVEIQSNLAETR